MTVDVNKYADELDQYLEGQRADGRAKVVISRVADQTIEFGRGVVAGTVKGERVKNITNSQAILDFDADFVTGNTIDLKVNGVAIVQVPFNTDQATTKADLISAIDNLDNVKAVDGGARAITITIDDRLSDADITDVVVAGGASQAGFTITVSTLDTKVEGIAIVRHNQPTLVGGDDNYQALDQVSVMSRGTVAVKAIATISYKDDVYINVADQTDGAVGRFTNVSTGNLKIEGAKFIKSCVGTPSVPAFTVVELNLPA
jgi:hypothetical protein